MRPSETRGRHLLPPPPDTVPCVFCAAPIDARAFVFLSSTHRLLRATCPACGHPAFRTAAAWLRLGGVLPGIRLPA